MQAAAGAGVEAEDVVAAGAEGQITGVHRNHRGSSGMTWEPLPFSCNYVLIISWYYVICVKGLMLLIY